MTDVVIEASSLFTGLLEEESRLGQLSTKTGLGLSPYFLKYARLQGSLRMATMPILQITSLLSPETG